MAAALLPSRRWAALEHRLPVASSALLSAVLTFMTGGIAGTLGYIDYASAQSKALTNATWTIAEEQVGHPEKGPEISSSTPMFVNAIAPVAFLFFTPLGLLSLYLVVSGAARAIAAAVDDPLGDPLLTGVEAVAVAVASRSREQRDRERREQVEGREIPDRAVSGKAAGMPGVDVVIVSSRRKPDWTAGLIVMTAEKWYRLGEPVERTVEGRLRTLYPLKAHTDLEVARRSVRYELPQSPQIQ